MLDEHVVILKSNAAPSLYPNNRPSYFYNPLDRPLACDEEEWRVALTEITFTNYVKTLQPDDVIHVWRKEQLNSTIDTLEGKKGEKAWREDNKLKVVTEDVMNFTLDIEERSLYDNVELIINDKPPVPYAEGETIHLNSFVLSGLWKEDTKIEVKGTKKASLDSTLKPTPGYYASSSALVAELNRTLGDYAAFKPSGSEKVALTELKDEYYLVLDGQLKYILGFEDSELTKKDVESEYTVDLHRGAFMMMIYSNLCEFSRVGDTSAPLLRTVHLKRGLRYGDVVNQVIEYPIYVPVARRVFNVVEVNLRLDSGDWFPLTKDAKLQLTLHLKKV